MFDKNTQYLLLLLYSFFSVYSVYSFLLISTISIFSSLFLDKAFTFRTYIN